MHKNSKSPILLIIFNRPEKVRLAMQAIALYAPDKLYITADGPRLNNATDIQKCEAARNEALKNVTWPCEVHTRFLDENYGCGPGPSSGISWFFEHEDKGIILEDDCLPHPHFFSYCHELLEKYEYVENVMKINGNLLADLNDSVKESYFFSKITQGPGFGTWRRAWKKFSFHLQEYEQFKSSDLLESINSSRSFKKYWIEKFNLVELGQKDIWDYQWTYAIWRNNGICITPSVNLVSNIGFDEEGTHTKGQSDLGNRKAYPILPLKHPSTIQINYKRDQYLFENIFFTKDEKISPSQLLKNMFKKSSKKHFENEQNLKYHPEKTIGSYIWKEKEWKFYSGAILRIEKDVIQNKWHLSAKDKFKHVIIYGEQSGILSHEIYNNHAFESMVIFQDVIPQTPKDLLVENLTSQGIQCHIQESASFTSAESNFLIGFVNDDFTSFFQKFQNWNVKEALVICNIKKESNFEVNCHEYIINFRGIYLSKRPLFYAFVHDSETINIVCIHLLKK